MGFAFLTDPSLETRVQELLAQIVRASNSYRLEAAARDVLIQTLTWLIPTETGIGWSKRFINTEGEYALDLSYFGTPLLSTITLLFKATLSASWKLLQQLVPQLLSTEVIQIYHPPVENTDLKRHLKLKRRLGCRKFHEVDCSKPLSTPVLLLHVFYQDYSMILGLIRIDSISAKSVWALLCKLLIVKVLKWSIYLTK